MADEPGLTTFVGRVRGRLDPVDATWVARTSDAVSALRLDLVAAAGRLGELEARVGILDPASDQVTSGPAAPGPDEDDPAPDPWARLVAWAGEVNAALVGLVARRRLPPAADFGTAVAVAVEQAAETVSTRALELGSLLHTLRGEHLVDELLTAGVLTAPPGTIDAIPFAEHGAWDIEFLGHGGVTIARADVRVSADPDDIAAHVAGRPGVDLVYTTSDAADGLVATDGVSVVRPGESWPADPEPLVVVDIGVDAAALHADLVAALDVAGSGASADALLDAVPVLALVLVGARAAARAATTQDPGADIATAAWGQTKDVVTTVGVSELVGWASGVNLLKVPATLTFSLGRAAVRDARASVSLSARRAARARRLVAASGPGPRVT